ncbi:iron complex outermembrane recepter protein [Roseateles sp. YR242]|uniref:TonB-dependent receptor plug domain-containing protein n=1 Tax=Roseateles sp. YR242 TaxID=1855305 RepID=UPI0008ADD413|nr:TonB-dependent receptor [Roseateles sp. YR242]SEK26997.1 iron complex outermembrane recepter protein [Roseateles sp. YR242]
MFKRRQVNLAALTVLGMSLPLSVLAQEAPPSHQLEKVEITGSSIRRVAAETALPVTTLTREEIARSGATTVQDLVALLPSSFGGGVVANNVGATGGAATANLRALGPKYTLVLLNGRRVANFAFGNNPVDLNAIPLAAVERVEVLRDGASSLYGADAVAGVINFILRRDFQGAEVAWSEYKGDHGNGGNSQLISGVAGFGDLTRDRFNVVVSASREEITPLKAADRAYAATAVRPDLGINKASPRNGISNITFTDTNGVKHTSVNPLRYGGCNDPGSALVIVSPTECGTDYAKFIDLIPDQWRANATTRGVLQLNEDNQLIAEVLYNRDRVQSVYSPAPYTKSLVYPTTGRFYPTSITLPDGTTVTPTGTITGTWRTVAGGGRSDITETKTTRGLFGAKGLVAGWDYDTAITYSKNEGEIFFGPGQYSYAKLTPLLAAGEINIFGPQDAESKAKLDSAQLTGRQQAATSTSTEVDFHVSRDVYNLPAGPLSVAFGANARREKLDQLSEPVLESGDVVGGSGPIPSVSSGRKVIGAMTEINVPIFQQLEANFSGRYDKYRNDFGTSFSNFSPKVSLRYQPMRDLVLRGSAARGFRAPTLYENLRPFTSGNNTAATWSDPLRCPGGVPITDTINPVNEFKDECNVQLDSATAGDRNLKPEKSRQFSLGLVFSPLRDLSTSVDYWNVEIRDPIVAKSELQVLSDPTRYKDYIYRYDPVNDPDMLNPIKGSTNKDLPIAYVFLPQENSAKNYASGLDLGAQWRFKTAAWGQFGVQLDGTLFLTHGYQYVGLSKTSDLGKFKDFGAVPRWRHQLTFNWRKAMWDFSLTNNFTAGYDDYTDPLASGDDDYPLVRKVASYTTWDTQASVSPTKSFTVSFGVKNLFDRDPPSSRNSLNFQVGYDPTYTNPIGRQLYGRLNYKFF